MDGLSEQTKKFLEAMFYLNLNFYLNLWVDQANFDRIHMYTRGIFQNNFMECGPGVRIKKNFVDQQLITIFQCFR